MYLGGLGVPLLCSSAKRSRLLPEVCDERSLAVRTLSPHERAITREVNETVFHLLETGGFVGSESRERVGYSILSTDVASLALRRLHFVVSDFRRLSVTEPREPCHWRLFCDF